MYRTVRTILQYDMIYTIHILYRTIHEHLRYVDTIRNFLHRIQYDFFFLGDNRFKFKFKFYLFRWESSIFVVMFLSVGLCLNSRTQNLVNYDLIPILELVGPNSVVICSLYWQYRHFLTRDLNFRIFYFWAFTAHKSKKGKIVSLALVIWFSKLLIVSISKEKKLSVVWQFSCS